MFYSILILISIGLANCDQILRGIEPESKNLTIQVKIKVLKFS